MMSSIGRYMILPHDESRPSIDIFDLASEPGNVVLFSLNASKPTDMGVIVGSMICTDLTNMTATRANSGQTNPVSVYVDEFQSLPPTAVKSMLEKARSANIGVTIAFQSMQQVTAASGNDAFINSLLDTCGNFIFHAGANESTAKIMSQIIGKHWVNDYTVQKRNQQGIFDFNFRNRRNMNMMAHKIEKYVIEPSAFQQLSVPTEANGYKSEAIIIKKASSDRVDTKTKGAVAHKVWMIPPDSVISDDYFDPQADVMRFHDEVPKTGLHDDTDDEYQFEMIPDKRVGREPEPRKEMVNPFSSSLDVPDSLFNDAPEPSTVKEPVRRTTIPVKSKKSSTGDGGSPTPRGRGTESRPEQSTGDGGNRNHRREPMGDDGSQKVSLKPHHAMTPVQQRKPVHDSKGIVAPNSLHINE